MYSCEHLGGNMFSKYALLVTVVFGCFANAEIHPTFERELKGEAQFQEEIVKGISYLQAEQAKNSKGPKLRGTHAKGVCAKAQFEILENQDHRAGIFGYAGVYPATVRFANGKGEVLPDQENDVRSLSFSVNMPVSISNTQGRMDFSTNDATIFPINDADVFAALMTIARKGKLWGIIEIGLERAMAAKNAFALGDKIQKPLSLPYQKLSYWSGVPFLFGHNQAIKYALTPCTNNPFQPVTTDPDTLSKELARHLSNDSEMACFDFQIQILDADKLTDKEGQKHSVQDWIENAAWEWPEQQIPFQTVAKLTLQKDSLLSKEACEAVRINVNKNTTPDHRGLGSINRARTGAEEQSAKNR